MAEEEPKKIETEAPAKPPAPVTGPPAEAPKDIAEEKAVIPIPPPPPPAEEKPQDSKALAVVESNHHLFLFLCVSVFLTKLCHRCFVRLEK